MNELFNMTASATIAAVIPVFVNFLQTIRKRKENISAYVSELYVMLLWLSRVTKNQNYINKSVSQALYARCKYTNFNVLGKIDLNFLSSFNRELFSKSCELSGPVKSKIKEIEEEFRNKNALLLEGGDIAVKMVGGLILVIQLCQLILALCDCSKKRYITSVLSNKERNNIENVCKEAEKEACEMFIENEAKEWINNTKQEFQEIKQLTKPSWLCPWKKVKFIFKRFYHLSLDKKKAKP